MRESVEIIYILQSEAKEVLVTAQDIYGYPYISIWLRKEAGQCTGEW